MYMLWSTLILTIGVIACVLGYYYTDFKKKELDFRQIDNDITQKALKEKINLDIEKERTKQHLLDKERESERAKQEEEKTKQMEIEAEKLRIKSEHEVKTGNRLY